MKVLINSLKRQIERNEQLLKKYGDSLPERLAKTLIQRDLEFAKDALDRKDAKDMLKAYNLLRKNE